jgi:hypothetical protein
MQSERRHRVSLLPEKQLNIGGHKNAPSLPFEGVKKNGRVGRAEISPKF